MSADYTDMSELPASHSHAQGPGKHHVVARLDLSVLQKFERKLIVRGRAKLRYKIKKGRCDYEKISSCGRGRQKFVVNNMQ